MDYFPRGGKEIRRKGCGPPKRQAKRQTLRGRGIRKKKGGKGKGKEENAQTTFRAAEDIKKEQVLVLQLQYLPLTKKHHHEEGRILSDFFLITITIAEEVKTTRDSRASQLRAKDSRSVSASEQTRLMSAISCSPHR